MLLVDIHIAEHILQTKGWVLLFFNLILLSADITLPEVIDGVLSTLASVHAPDMDAFTLAVRAGNCSVWSRTHTVIKIHLCELMSASFTKDPLNRFLWLLLLLFFYYVVNISTENVFRCYFGNLLLAKRASVLTLFNPCCNALPTVLVVARI